MVFFLSNYFFGVVVKNILVQRELFYPIDSILTNLIEVIFYLGPVTTFYLATGDDAGDCKLNQSNIHSIT